MLNENWLSDSLVDDCEDVDKTEFGEFAISTFGQEGEGEVIFFIFLVNNHKMESLIIFVIKTFAKPILPKMILFTLLIVVFEQIEWVPTLPILFFKKRANFRSIRICLVGERPFLVRLKKEGLKKEKKFNDAIYAPLVVRSHKPTRKSQNISLSPFSKNYYLTPHDR